jgi:beta-phosphoglucomutase-like phosphatase (HAD superfamily)
MKNILPKNLEAVFLDFDGVVVESANIKSLAFYELYLPYGSGVAELAKEYHLKNQGISRYKKFDDINKLFLNNTYSEDEKESLSNRFSEIVFKKIIQAPFVEGVLNFLKEMQGKHITVFLLSATPHQELITICKAKGILDYFTDIHGHPDEKSAIGQKIITQRFFSKENSVFIGDSLSDFKAASAMQVNFIGRVPDAEKSPFDSSVYTIKDFKDLMI